MNIDHLVLKGCREHNRLAQEKLYRLCYPILMQLIMRYVNNEDEAKDVLNKSMFKALTKIDQFSGNEHNFFGWIKRIAVNHALDQLRANSRIPKNQDINHANYIGEESPVFASETKHYVQSLLNRIPKLSALVFNLYAMEGFSHDEISKQLDITRSNSKWHLHSARKKLQEMLSQNSLS